MACSEPEVPLPFSVVDIVNQIGPIIVNACTREVPKIFVNIGELRAPSFVEFSPRYCFPYFNHIYPDPCLRLRKDWCDTYFEFRCVCQSILTATHRDDPQMLIALRARIRQLNFIYLNLEVSYFFTLPVNNENELKTYIARVEQCAQLRMLYMKTMRVLTYEIEDLLFRARELIWV